MARYCSQVNNPSGCELYTGPASTCSLPHHVEHRTYTDIILGSNDRLQGSHHRFIFTAAGFMADGLHRKDPAEKQCTRDYQCEGFYLSCPGSEGNPTPEPAYALPLSPPDGWMVGESLSDSRSCSIWRRSESQELWHLIATPHGTDCHWVATLAVGWNWLWNAHRIELILGCVLNPLKAFFPKWQLGIPLK